MRPRISFCVGLFWAFSCMGFAVQAQDLGPGFTKVKDGIYVFAAADAGTATCSFVVTEEGVVMIDSLPKPVGFPQNVDRNKKSYR